MAIIVLFQKYAADALDNLCPEHQMTPLTDIFEDEDFFRDYETLTSTSHPLSPLPSPRKRLSLCAILDIPALISPLKSTPKKRKCPEEEGLTLDDIFADPDLALIPEEDLVTSLPPTPKKRRLDLDVSI